MFKTNNEIHRNVVVIQLFNLVTVQTTYTKNFLDVAMYHGILIHFFFVNRKTKNNTIRMYTIVDVI